ncbi:hypothetical protein C2S53_016813 [Perilla frutescens var. hirtella]|uniref:DCD domain-containing protein n=1 Tax=Perilla frutescens var. hirtella TaxID=608512 RepID=A0AAD4P0M8_PERFH|nr:hypothetical protein C2S53_016813 [Perilla frutescens var. hirtella]
MAPRKNKKKVSAAAKSTSEEVVSSKRSLRRLKKAFVASESTPEEVVSDKKIVDDKKDGDAKEPIPTPKVRKPCTWLKLDRLNTELGSKSSLKSCDHGKEAKPATQVIEPIDNKRKRNEKGVGKGHDHPEKLNRLNLELGSKSSLHSCEQGKEEKPTAQVRDLKDDKRRRNEKGEGKGHYHPVTNEKHNSRPEKKEKEIINGRHEDTKKMDDESEKELGGLIFMCNAKTKPDCFKYQIMGVPANKKGVVMSIKPGLKFFLYDYDLKVMYGVFEASSTGGMKLEPAAFGGGFPAQVRFIVHKDCLPLPESVFKKAIKDSYDKRTNKFRTELTVKQVRNLIAMFNPTPLLHPNGKSLVQEPSFCPVPSATSLNEESLVRQKYLNGNLDTQGKSIPLHHEKQFSDNHVFHSTGPPRDPLFLTEQEYRNNGLRQGRHLLPATAGDNVSNHWEPMKLDVELKHLLRNPASTSTDSADPFFLGEKEYRTYGLRGPQQVPRKNSYDPYDDEATTSLVNRYLSLPMTTAVPAESYPLAGREPYISDLSHTSHMLSHPARTIPDGDRGFASRSFRDQSVFNQRSYSLNDSCEPSELSRGVSLQRQADLLSAPVSHRYSFAGPSLSHHR